MKPEHKKYILENINKKSLKEISQELNLKERKIRKFLEKHRGMKRQIDSQQETRIPIKKKTAFISIALIIILGFVVYSNSLNGEFVWDDDKLIKDNIYIKNWSNISKIFTESIGAGIGFEDDFYRPFQMITYMTDYSLWKLDVRGYHLTNILLHIFVALAIFWLINILYDNWLLSLFTSILFVIHPLHIEAIAYISGRSDPLALVLMLLCFIFYVKKLHVNPTRNIIAKRVNSIGLYILILSTYILALLSRENSLILPILLLLYHYTFKKKLKAKEFLPILSIAFIYILLRLTVLKFLLPHVSYTTTLFQRLPGFFVATTNYLRLIFLPFNLHMEYGNKLFHLADPRSIVGILILAFLLIYASRVRNNNRLAFFSISWFFIALLPVSNLYPINAYMAEHWLYLPSIGFFLLLAKGLTFIYRTKKNRIYTIVFLTGLLAFYSYLTIRQNTYWKGPLVFYERTLKYAPNSSRAHNNLALIYQALDRKQEAMTLYKKAIELNPHHENAYNNLGIVYNDIGRKEEAIASFKKVIELNPNHAEAYNNLGFIYNNSGKKEEATALYKKAIDINPNYSEAYNNLGMLYISIGNNQEALASFKKAIEINPNHIDTYNNLALLYQNIGKNEEAITLYKKAIVIEPNNAGLYNNLALLYQNIGKNEEAITLYKKAIVIEPNNAGLYNNLALLYQNIGKNEEAITLYKKAIVIEPNYAAGYFNLSLVYFREKQYALSIKHCDKAVELGYRVSPEFLELLEPYRK